MSAQQSQKQSQLVEHAMQSVQAGRWQEAVERLEAARRDSPADLFVLMTLAGARGQSGDSDGEFEAIQGALAVDAYFVPAMLLKGNWFERHGDAVAASTHYANALKISPPEQQWPGQYRAELVHAGQFVEDHTRRLNRHLAEQLTQAQSALAANEVERWSEAISIRAGKTTPYVSDSNQLYVPRLPAIPFFDRSVYPFLRELEENTDIIRDELLAALEQDADKFQPYIAYQPGDPVNQWQELDHSPRWKALHLWRGGVPATENLQRCPKTAELLRKMSLCDLEGLCPNAFFSALAPKTHIPPHNGESNARVIAHLPLIVPEGCRLRVGFEERQWTIGEVLVFDDTLEHEAFNDSDELRVVMIFDLWNPLLSAAERRMASALAKATREFRG